MEVGEQKIKGKKREEEVEKLEWAWRQDGRRGRGENPNSYMPRYT